MHEIAIFPEKNYLDLHGEGDPTPCPIVVYVHSVPEPPMSDHRPTPCLDECWRAMFAVANLPVISTAATLDDIMIYWCRSPTDKQFDPGQRALLSGIKEQHANVASNIATCTRACAASGDFHDCLACVVAESALNMPMLLSDFTSTFPILDFVKPLLLVWAYQYRWQQAR